MARGRQNHCLSEGRGDPLSRESPEKAAKGSTVASRFDDPVAMETEWTPASKGGTNFRTHKLVQVRPDRMAFVPTLGMKLFALVFIVVGLAAGIGIPIAISQQRDRQGFKLVLPIIFGAGFAAAGMFMWLFAIKPRVFDKSARYFWKGRKTPEVIFGGETSENWAPLEEIHALQILAERVRSEKNFYMSYELNLILKDGRRLMVVDHGHLKKMLADAKRLSEFLGVPVWDAG